MDIFSHQLELDNSYPCLKEFQYEFDWRDIALDPNNNPLYNSWDEIDNDEYANEFENNSIIDSTLNDFKSDYTLKAENILEIFLNTQDKSEKEPDIDDEIIGDELDSDFIEYDDDFDLEDYIEIFESESDDLIIKEPIKRKKAIRNRTKTSNISCGWV